MSDSDNEILNSDNETFEDESMDDESMDEDADILIDDDDYKDRLKPVNKIKIDPKNMFRKDGTTNVSNVNKRSFEDDNNQIMKKPKMSIKSHFFTNAIVKSYLSSISDQLTNKTIINLDQLESYFGNDIRNTYYSIAVRLRQELPKQGVCDNISKSYLSENLERGVEQPGAYVNYDTAFLVDTTLSNDIINIESAIIGLIIVQRNECNKFSNAYALKLVCSRKCQNCGIYLLGLYLYSILSHPKKSNTNLILEPIIPPSDENVEYFGPPILHMGILELAGSYITAGALCLYTKFGFTINSNLSGNNAAGMSFNCFDNSDNIAMVKRFKTDESIQNLDTLDNVINDVFDVNDEKEKIIRIVKKADPGYKKHIICEFRNKNTQRKLGELYIDLQINQKKYATLVHQSKFILNRNGDEIKPEFKQKMMTIEDEIKTINGLIDKIEGSQRNITVEELGFIGGVRSNKTNKLNINNKQTKKTSKYNKKYKTKNKYTKNNRNKNNYNKNNYNKNNRNKTKMIKITTYRRKKC
jgi:hypothetical protein